MILSALIAQQANFGNSGIQPVSPLGAGAATDPTGELEILISTGIGVLTVVGSLFFIAYFFMAGIKWLTAGGDGSKVQKARDEMIQGVLGLIVIVASYGIIGLISTILGLNILNPAQQIDKIIGGIGGGLVVDESGSKIIKK